MCTPPYSLFSDGWHNRHLFSLHSSLLQKSLHSGGLQLPSPPLGLKRYSQTSRNSRGEEVFDWVIFSDLLPSQWPWHTHPSPSLFWQSLLPWHLLCSVLSCPFLLLGGASGPGFWPPTNSSIYPSLSGLSPQRAYPFLQFSESSLGWLCLPLSFSRGILVSFSFRCCCSLYLSGTEYGQLF